MAARSRRRSNARFGRIAGYHEMTSSSGLGSTTVVLQFDCRANIDAAATDVQAAINAAARSCRRTCLATRPIARSIPRMRPRSSCR
jgi:multidrug efflux pump